MSKVFEPVIASSFSPAARAAAMRRSTSEDLAAAEAGGPLLVVADWPAAEGPPAGLADWHAASIAASMNATIRPGLVNGMSFPPRLAPKLTQHVLQLLRERLQLRVAHDELDIGFEHIFALRAQRLQLGHGLRPRQFEVVGAIVVIKELLRVCCLKRIDVQLG